MHFDHIQVGTDGPDDLGPFNGPTLMFGLGGDDKLVGGNAGDCISGGDGSDTIYGNNGPDTLYGDAGSDRVFGANGPDVIDGGPDADLCDGGRGPNSITNCESQPSTDPCDPDGVQVVWDARPTGIVFSARVFDVEATCAGKGLSIAIRDGTGAVIGRSGRIAAGTADDLVVEPTMLFAQLPDAPCSPDTCTLQLGPTTSDGTYAGGRGVAGSMIEEVEVTIGALP